MRIIQRNIAEKLGIHRSTVSRALRGDPTIPAATRERVLAACKEHDYQPNSLLSEFAAARWATQKGSSKPIIGYIDCIRPGARVGLEMVSALRVQASVLGFQVESFLRADFSNSAKLQRKLRSLGITDVIIGPIYEKCFAVELDWSKFNCIQLVPGFFSLGLHSVVRNHFNAVVLAWQKAVDAGYRRIGIILLNHSFKLMDDVMRTSAANACQNQLFPDLPVIPVFFYSASDQREKEFANWVRTHQPEVIIGFTPAHYHIFHAEFGFGIPYVSLHLDGKNSISGISRDDDTLATEGVNLIHHCRRSYQWGVPARRIDHVIEPVWFEGSTLPQCST